MDSNLQQIAVVIGATSKWQADGRNTRLVHGGTLDDSGLPVGMRWGVGGAEVRRRGLLHGAHDTAGRQRRRTQGSDRRPGRLLHDR